jgi:cell division protein FtsI/penicillin-binding protein 2
MPRLLRILAAVALIAAACTNGDGVQPAESTSTSEAATTPTSQAPETTTSTTLDDDDRRAATAIAESYLASWAAGDWEAAAALTTNPTAAVRDAHAAWADWLLLTNAAVERTEARIAGEAVEVGYRMTVDTTALGTWSYEGTVRLVEDAGRWSVDWTPATLHPSLSENDVITVVRDWGPRGSILAHDGRPIVSGGEIHVIGVVPQWIEDLDALLTALEEVAGIPPETVTDELERPGVQPDWFLPVGDMSAAEYAAYGEELAEVPGVLIRSGQSRLSVAEPFADQIVGTTGPITAEMLEELGPPYDETSTVGRYGLELAFERSLAGAPAQEVRVVNQFGRVIDVLHSVPGAEPTDVATTLDIEAQLAAEAAVDGIDLPVALVALDLDTGAVRAAAVRPAGGFDRAFSGLYPPGSTFKIVTASALLAGGLDPEEPVDCPAEVTVDGRPFRNVDEMDLGDVPLITAFSASCNTTFAFLAAIALEQGDLEAWAARYGLGTDPILVVPAATSRFPDPPDLAGRSAAAIGQGQVLITPVHAASMAAAAVTGVWRSPWLTTDADPVVAEAFDPAIPAFLTEAMLAVVAEGTGQPAQVEGEDVRGKTGSAEFMGEDGLATHAWFVGTWSDLAFAVVVEGGGAGGRVAGPIAAEFITTLLELQSG